MTLIGCQAHSSSHPTDPCRIAAVTLSHLCVFFDCWDEVEEQIFWLRPRHVDHRPHQTKSCWTGAALVTS